MRKRNEILAKKIKLIHRVVRDCQTNFYNFFKFFINPPECFTISNLKDFFKTRKHVFSFFFLNFISLQKKKRIFPAVHLSLDFHEL